MSFCGGTESGQVERDEKVDYVVKNALARVFGAEL